MASDLITKAIDSQGWLDPLGSEIQKVVHQAFEAAGEAGQPLKDALHGVWLGHPLHPVLTDIPIGAWTAALALDALESITGNRSLRSGADAAVGVGLLGAAGAALTGLTDYSEVDGEARKVGAMHAVLNVLATGLYTGSYFLRKNRKSRNTGIALSLLGYAVTGASSLLGGHLVFAEQIGVDHTAGPESGQPTKFVPVLTDADLPEKKLTKVMAGDVAVLLVRIDGKIHAIRETCSHLGGPLSEGTLEDGTVICPWHGSRFELPTGDVVNGPSCYQQPRFNVRVRKGNIEVRAEK